MNLRFRFWLSLSLVTCSMFTGCDSEAARKEAELDRLAKIQAVEDQKRLERFASPDSTALIRGMDNPTIIKAAAATLADDAEVLGVVVNGHARAYTVEAMSRVVSHVMNDRIAGVSVTMTFCDRTGCTRAFQGPGEEPLDFWVAGWKDGRLQLKVDETTYFQEDEAIPFATVPTERTTWKAWRTAHPDTDLHP